MTTNEPIDLAYWMPSILECTFESWNDSHDGWLCAHPNAGDEGSAATGFDAMYGLGETPVKAYGAMLVELTKWQMVEQLRREDAKRDDDHEFMYACRDDDGHAARED